MGAPRVRLGRNGVGLRPPYAMLRQVTDNLGRRGWGCPQVGSGAQSIARVGDGLPWPWGCLRDRLGRDVRAVWRWGP